MNIQLSDHFTYKKLLLFTFPSIAMMVFTSLYTVIDGFFVSNFVGKTPFAGMNFIIPFLVILGTVGFMFGAGGSALVSKTLGEKNSVRANQLFSLITYVSITSGIVLTLLGQIFLRPIAVLMGAEGQLLEDCLVYGRIHLLGLPVFILQITFQNFMVAAEKPQLSFMVAVASGFTNMILDAVFIIAFKWGLVGAAAATVIGQVVGGGIPLIYFSRRNTSLLRLGKAPFDAPALLKTCVNGISEFVSNIAGSLIAILYNIQLMKYIGENGVAAYGVLMYVNEIFLAVFIGYAIGSAPVISFHYGAQNHSELKSLLKKSLVIISRISVGMFVIAELSAKSLSSFFVGYDKALMEMSTHAFLIYSFSFLFSGITFFGSSFFTALNNGLTSALISFLRTLLFQTTAVFILPMLLDLDGIWISFAVSEFMAVTMTVFFLLKNKEKYQY